MRAQFPRWKILFSLLALFWLSPACSDDDKKRVGDTCLGNEDCADEICHQGICWSANPQSNGASCDMRAVCKSGVCANAICVQGSQVGGTSCLYNEMCASSKCQAGTCVSLGVDAGPGDSGPIPDLPHKDTGSTDLKVRDLALPEAMPLDVGAPDAAKPDAAKPDAAKPDALQPDSAPWADALSWPDLTAPDLLPTGHCLPGMKRPCYTGSVGCTGTPSTGYTCVKDSVCKAGVQTCAAPGPWPVATPTTCVGQTLPGLFEVCNDKDDTCNGKVDDGIKDVANKGQACTAGKGLCQGTGTWACNSAQTAVECNAKEDPSKKKAETCDGTDEDCDGAKDNGRCFSAWTKLPFNTPTKLIGSTYALAAEGKVVLAGGADAFLGGTILRSDDSGQTWKRVLTNLSNEEFQGIDLSGSTAVAAGKKGTLYYSTNAGATWTAGAQCGTYASDVVIHKGTTLVSSQSMGRICRSLDGGKTIADSQTFTDTTFKVLIYSVTLNTVSGKMVGLAVGKSANNSSALVPVYRSIDGGKNWALANTGITGPIKYRLRRVRLATSGHAYITSEYMGSSGSPMHLSANAGTSWTMKTLTISTNSRFQALAVGPKGVVLTCATTAYMCFLSRDNGANFAKEPVFPSGSYGAWSDMAFDGVDAVYVANYSYGQAFRTVW